MNSPVIVIVGSGPSALAAATMVVHHGHTPLVVDAAIGGTNPDPDDFQEEQNLKTNTNSKKSPGRKTWLGSDLPYRQHPKSRLNFQKSEPIPSYSFSGFSRVWGAACSFYHELNEWPNKFNLIEQDSLMAAQLLGFKDSSLKSTGLRHSKSAIDLMQALSSGTFEKRYATAFSNLAINIEPEVKNSCQYCNQCITGCPYDAIWTSGNTFRSMRDCGMIHIKSGYFLQEIKVESGRVTQLLFSTQNGNTEILKPDYVFLATGAISTAELLINSRIVDEVKISDSSTAFSAMLRIGRNSDDKNSNHSLSQVWISAKTGDVHFQIYSPSPGLEKKLIENFPLMRFFPKLSKWLAGRVLPIISYLPSESSGTLRVKKTNQDLIVSVHGGFKAKIKQYVQLLRLAFELLPKGYILPFALSKIPNPGAGYHFGASIPMGDKTNQIGQLPGISNLSVIDSSVLPRIEAGSITPTVMANSARISRIVCERFYSS
jgi:choline dehydrogenase-like flavoprotein